MKKNNILIFVGAFFYMSSVSSAGKNKDLSLPQNSLTMGVNFASTYKHRDQDINAAMSSPAAVFNFAPVIQPELTVFTPLRGLYFDLFATIALRGREEKNLKKNDSLDFAVIYDFFNRVGLWSMSYALYAKIQTGENFGEIYFAYTFPFQVVNLSLAQSVAHSFRGSLGFLYSEISLAKPMGKIFIPTLLVGYRVQPIGKQSGGHLDLVLPFQFDFSSKIQLKFGATISYLFPMPISGNSPWKVVFQSAVFYSI